ncbi:MAG: hypothetical protein GAK45_01677 [Pseudomonas citronellolis]|nr:MAG: hypothetical protein GAK45_01677 [Pseudomonas citronellolis]
MPTRPSLLIRFYRPVSWLACAALLLCMLAVDWVLLTPREISGTLFGGFFATFFALLSWLCCNAGLCAALLVRLPGARITLLLAGTFGLLMSIWWRAHYPDDADGNLTFSPSPGELGGSTLVFIAMIGLTILLQRRGYLRACSDEDALLPFRLFVAAALATFFLVLPLRLFLLVRLPPCSFSASGQQLSVCLGDDEPSERSPTPSPEGSAQTK